jgi:hypothetical protein
LAEQDVTSTRFGLRLGKRDSASQQCQQQGAQQAAAGRGFQRKRSHGGQASGFIGKPITALRPARNKQLFLNDCSAPVDSQARRGPELSSPRFMNKTGLQPRYRLGL